LRGSRKGRQARRITKLWVEKAGSFFRRGVLLDIAALKGVDMLPDDYMITVADIEAAMTRRCRGPQGTRCLIAPDGPAVDSRQFPLHQGRAGHWARGGEFLVKRNVMMVGSDQLAVEVRPYPTGLFLPVHWLSVNVNGIYLIENLDSRRSRATRPTNSPFIVAPLKLRGGNRIERRADCGEIANHWRRHERSGAFWRRPRLG